MIAGDTEAIEAAEAQVQQERTQVEEAEAVAVAAESRGVSPDFGSRQGLGSTTSDLGVALAPSNTSGEMALLKLERFTTEMSESIKEETATREAALKQCTVFGGSGFIGKAICKALAVRGISCISPRAPTRLVASVLNFDS